MSDILVDFLAYHDEANQAYIHRLTRADKVPEAALHLFSHILNAHSIWLDRIHGRKTAFGPWEDQPRERFAAIHAANMEESRQLLSAGRLDRQIQYANTQGHTFSNSVGQILLHILNHSTYHRGQVATWLRRSGLEVPGTDYIMLRRDSV